MKRTYCTSVLDLKRVQFGSSLECLVEQNLSETVRLE